MRDLTDLNIADSTMFSRGLTFDSGVITPKLRFSNGHQVEPLRL